MRYWLKTKRKDVIPHLCDILIQCNIERKRLSVGLYKVRVQILIHKMFWETSRQPPENIIWRFVSVWSLLLKQHVIVFKVKKCIFIACEKDDGFCTSSATAIFKILLLKNEIVVGFCLEHLPSSTGSHGSYHHWRHASLHHYCAERLKEDDVHQGQGDESCKVTLW